MSIPQREPRLTRFTRRVGMEGGRAGGVPRREFMRWAGCAVVAGALPTGCGTGENRGVVPGGAQPAASATSRGASGWQVGCYTRPWDQHDYRVALDGIAEAGFRYAGLMTAKGPSWVLLRPDTSLEEAVRLGEEAKQRGLRLVSVYGDWPAPTEAAVGERTLRQLIAGCAACGSPDLMLGGTTDERLYDLYYGTIATCCADAASRGVRMTIKPHGGQNATGPQCRRAIERVGHSAFKLWYDPGNIFYYSEGRLDPAEDAATVDGLVVGMSVKDYLPPKEVNVTPGTGRVDFRRVLARLRQGGFRSGPLLVECVARGDGTDVRRVTEEARRARLFLEEVLAEPMRTRS